MLNGHGGNIYEVARRLNCALAELSDMSNNINPLGPPPGMMDFLKDNIEATTRLPEVDNKEVIKYFADRFFMHPDCVLAGNGTTQFIYMIPRILKTKRALILGPTYADYADACSMHNVGLTIFVTEESDNFQPDISKLTKKIAGNDTVFICNPNNPTGALIPREELLWLCRSHPDNTFIIDESYLPFVKRSEKESMINSGLANVIVLLSISKICKIPGLRIGFIAGCTETIKKFSQYQLPWTVNSLAQAAVRYLTSQEANIAEFINKTKLFIESQRKAFSEKFAHIPEIKLLPGTTPFVLIKLPDFLSAGSVCARLVQDKILVRDCSNFHGLSDQFIRISLKTREENQTLAEKLLSLIQR
jgi:threonine-phosphate decarboxylase